MSVRCASLAPGLLALGLLASSTATAQTVGVCKFDRLALQFAGTPPQQAACLLRPVAKWGQVSVAPATLPAALAALVGQPAAGLLPRLQQVLAARGVAEADVGGPLEGDISHGNGGDSAAPAARYFVIHDTSAPWLGDAPAFPPDDAPALNEIAQYAGPESVAHVFVNRLGQSLTGHDFSQPWRATKLESQSIGLPAKGLFLHIELIQPRRRDPSGGPKNDAIAPLPGFTAAQYERLALLYAAASARSGSWLIPAFHAAIDEGLSDAHDDPQNFDIAAFAAALAPLLQTSAEAPTPQPQFPKVQAPAEPSSACAAIVTGLAQLKPAAELPASNSGGKTWQQIYADCDANDRFAGQALPSHNGKSLRCSTDKNRVESVVKYADGTVVYTAKMSVDADGSPVVGGSGWPNDVQTWLTFDAGSKDHFVNAEEVPFIVLPLPVANTAMSFPKDTGIRKGDLAVVVKADKCSFAVVGDAGPWFRLGEASLRAHEDLGNPQCKVAGQHPCRQLKGGSGIGIESGVRYLVFPGSRPKPLLSQTVNAVVEKAAAEKALDFLKANAR